MKTIRFNAEFEIGDIVYHVSDPDQERLVVVSYSIDAHGVMYVCSSRYSSRQYYKSELTTEKSIM